MLPITTIKHASDRPDKLLARSQKIALVTDIAIIAILMIVGTLILLTAKGMSLQGMNAMSKLGIGGGIAFAAGGGILALTDAILLIILSIKKRNKLNQNPLSQDLFVKLSKSEAPKVKDWLEKHQSNFISYGMDSKEASIVLQSTQLSPSEKIFRKKQTSPSPSVKLSDDEASSLANIATPLYMTDFVEIRNQKSSNDLVEDWLLEVYINETTFSNFQALCIDYAKTKQGSPNDWCSIAVAYDEQKSEKERFDLCLSRNYNNIITEIESSCQVVTQEGRSYTCADRDQIHNYLLKARQNVLGTGSVVLQFKENHIEASNCITILKGNPNQIRSFTGFKEEQFVSKYPWENEGKIFELDLKAEDLLIIGPKKILSKYKDYTNVVYLEDL